LIIRIRSIRTDASRSGLYLHLADCAPMTRLRIPTMATLVQARGDPSPSIRLMRLVCSPTRLSRSRWGRLASCSSTVGMAAILQCSLSPQPTKKGVFQELGVKPIGLGAPTLTRHCHARGMNDMGLDTARSQPAGRPEAVLAGLVPYLAVMASGSGASRCVFRTKHARSPPLARPRRGSAVAEQTQETPHGVRRMGRSLQAYLCRHRTKMRPQCLLLVRGAWLPG